MAATVARLQAVLDADTSRFDRNVRASEGHFRRFGSVIKTGALAAGAAIGTGLAISAKVGFDEFNEGQKVAAQTAAVLKSTGSAANVTAKQIDQMATSMMMKTGIDDEAIKTGSNLLLTFTNIRNEVGKGNDIFNQANKTVQDMSVALGQDTKSSAIQLGKALNDPIRGITALRRVGVSFNDAQTETITGLVESGKTMKAQKLILAELHKEFGGSAEAAGKTFSGQLNVLKETFRNTAGEIVGRFMPLIVSLAKVVLPLVARGLEFVADWLGKFGDAATKRGGEVRGVFEAIWGFIRENVVPIILRLRDIAVETFRRFKKVIEDNREPLQRIADRLGALFRFLGTILLPIIKLVFQEVLPRVLNAAIQIIDKVSGAIETVIGWFQKARDKAVTLWGKITGAIGAAWDKTKLLRDAIVEMLDRVTGPLKTVAGLFGDIKGAVSGAAGAVGGFFGDGAIGTGIGGFVGSASARSVSPTLFDDLALAQSSGLSLSSGYRPGAVTSTGNPSLHGVYPAKAIDVAGSESAMRRFFLMEAARGALTGLREVIHSPYWWHPGSGISRIPASAGSVLADHYNHVHVGSYDQGGFLRPGWNLAYNGTGRPEAVGGGTVYNFNGPVLDGDKLLRFIQSHSAQYERRNGRRPF